MVKLPDGKGHFSYSVTYTGKREGFFIEKGPWLSVFILKGVDTPQTPPKHTQLRFSGEEIEHREEVEPRTMSLRKRWSLGP